MSIKIKGFTPAPDILLEKYGPITALVYGKIWRYTEAYGKTNATHDRLARELGIKDRTLRNHLKLLLEAEYIRDLTPTLKNKPHTYVPTTKLSLEIEIEMKSHPESNSASPLPTRNLIPPHPESNSAEDSPKDTEKKKREESTPDGVRPPTPYVLNSEKMERCFSEARGCPLPDWEHDPKGSNKRWRIPLNKILKACDGNVEAACYFIAEITREFRKDNLAFTAPDQILESVTSRIIDRKSRQVIYAEEH